jgi:hypothetical protein
MHMSRSTRVARGFYRIAILGLVLGVSGAIACDVIALMDHGKDISVVAGGNYAEFPQRLSDPEISKALVSKWGEPKVDPWDEYAKFSNLEGVPYAQEIGDARERVLSNVASDKQWMWIWLTLGGIWAFVWFALSWIVRGFMVD